MASLVMAALPVQIAAPILLRATRMSPISAAYTAAVEEDWELRRLREMVFKSRSRGSFFPLIGGYQEKCARRSCDRCDRASNRGGMEPAHERGTGGA